MATPIGTRPIPFLSDRDPERQQFFEEVKFRLDNQTAVSGVQSIVPGNGIQVDNTDPRNPVVSVTGGGSSSSGGGFVPTLLKQNQVFTVPEDTQALFMKRIKLQAGARLKVFGILVQPR